MRRFWAVCALLLVMCLPGGAEPLEVGGKPERLRLRLEGGRQKRYIRIQPDEALILRVGGPANLGLRCRELWIGKEAVPPVHGSPSSPKCGFPGRCW
jgi:hypothetical protein